MKRKMASVLLAGTLLLTAVGCGSSASTTTGKDVTNSTKASISSKTTESTESTATNTATSTASELKASNVFTDADKDTSYDESNSKVIELNNESITINKEGTYILSGTISNGQVVVDATNTSKIKIVLNGVTINNNTSAAIYVKQADKVFITTAKGSVNTLSNKSEFINKTGEEIDAVIYSKDDISLNGEGTLNINAVYGNGIVSKDDLVISSGSYNITAKNHGLRGKDAVKIGGGTINVKAGKDAIHAENNDDTSKGYIYVSGGDIKLESESDAMDAMSLLQVDGGNITISSGDDGMHSDDKLIVKGGKVDILKSVEGIEGKQVDIKDGVVNIVSSDDGINATEKTTTTTTDSTTSSDKTTSKNTKSSSSTSGADTNTSATNSSKKTTKSSSNSSTKTTDNSDTKKSTTGNSTKESSNTANSTVKKSRKAKNAENLSEGNNASTTNLNNTNKSTVKKFRKNKNSNTSSSTGNGTDNTSSTNNTNNKKMKRKSYSQNENRNGNEMPQLLPNENRGDMAPPKNGENSGNDLNMRRRGPGHMPPPDANGDMSQRPEGNPPDGEFGGPGGQGGFRSHGGPGGQDGFGGPDGNGGQGGGSFENQKDTYIKISGGTVNINAEGDAIDSNGSLYVTGGTTYISGPSNAGNGALDYNGTATIIGGTIITASSAGMSQNFGSDSTQGSILLNLSSQQSAGTKIEVKNSSGKVIASYTPKKAYSSILISTSEIKKGETYTITAGSFSQKVEMTDIIYGQSGGPGGMGGFRH